MPSHSSRTLFSESSPQGAKVDITKVMHSISDPMCLALRPRTEESEEMLEEIMPLEDIPSGSMVTASMEEITPLMDSQWDLL